MKFSVEKGTRMGGGGGGHERVLSLSQAAHNII